MRFVPVKRHEQLDMQALHRVRAQFVHQRTAIVSQFRCFLLKYGIAIHTGIGMFRRDATRILADDSNDLTPTMRQLLTDLWSDFLRIDERVITLSGQIEASAKHDDVVQRLVRLQVGLDELRWYQLHVVAEALKFAGQILRATACFDADKARWMLCHKLQELMTPRLLAQHDFASSVAADDVEPALAEIDS